MTAGCVEVIPHDVLRKVSATGAYEAPKFSMCLLSNIIFMAGSSIL